MKGVYPEFADKVDFYAVGYSAIETLGELETDRIESGYPWPVSEPVGRVLADFRVLSQSTKVAIGSNGVIVYRDGKGRGDVDRWREVFQQLAAGSAQ